MAGALTLTALGCSIYSVPDDGLESGGSSGSPGNDGGGGNLAGSAAGSAEVPEGGDTAAGGSSAAGGSGAGGAIGGASGGDGGSAGTSGGTGGSDGGTAGTSGGTGGSDGGSGGSAGSTGGSGGTAGGFAGSGGGIVELALNKPSTGSSDQQPAHPFHHGNDGDVGTRWCAVQGTFPEHWRVDLGAEYELTNFEVRWEKSNSDYSYEVATSLNDVTYTPQVTRTASGGLQMGTMMPGTIGRFVRVTVTGATGNTWASLFEFKVFGR